MCFIDGYSMPELIFEREKKLLLCFISKVNETHFKFAAIYFFDRHSRRCFKGQAQVELEGFFLLLLFVLLKNDGADFTLHPRRRTGSGGGVLSARGGGGGKSIYRRSIFWKQRPRISPLTCLLRVRAPLIQLIREMHIVRWGLNSNRKSCRKWL